MSKTPMCTNLLETFQIFTKFVIKQIRAHRGLRHYWGVRVRGQHTKTTGRR